MRVAIFTDNDFEKVNGVTTTLQAVLRHAPPGIEPRIYTAARHAIDERSYFAVPSLGVPIPFYSEMKLYVPRVGTYLQRAKQDRIDVVHLTTPGPIGLAAMRVARRLRLPMVGSFHTDLAAYARILSGSRRLANAMRRYMEWPYSRCARVLVPSEATRELLAGTARADTELAIWKRGVDCDLFHPMQRSGTLRQRWQASRRVPVVLYAGRVSREKGLDLLPAMHQRLRAAGVPHRLVIAGSGPMLPELRERMPQTIFTGSLGRGEIARVFASADVFVFPSRTDTAGNVVLEAQASGLPVLVSDAGGPKENMIDGVTGAVVRSADPALWADAIASMLSDESRRAALSRAARQYGESRSWSVALEPLFRTYLELARDAQTERKSRMPTPRAVASGPIRI